MKEHVMSYLLDTPQWWSGLNITNHGSAPTIVKFEYFNHHGLSSKIEEVSLKAGEQKKFAVKIPYDTEGWGWARAISDDNVTIVQFIGETGVSSMAVPIVSRPLP